MIYSVWQKRFGYRLFRHFFRDGLLEYNQAPDAPLISRGYFQITMTSVIGVL